MSNETRGKCFVIMPISETSKAHTKDYWTGHFTYLKTIIESFPLIAYRSAPLRGDVVREIIKDLVTVPIVVADLTDSNPNVFWELGVRQSFKQCTITIAEHGTSLPFDVSVKATLYYYPNEYQKMEEFKGQFVTAIQDCLNYPSYPDSPVLDTISGRGTLYQILSKEEALRKLDALLSEIKRNSEIAGMLKERLLENITLRKAGKKDDMQVIILRFRTPAVEALCINRYLDTDDAFYLRVEKCFEQLVRLNENLSLWDGLADATILEKRMLSRIENDIKIISAFQTLVTEQRGKLSLLL